MRLVRYGCAMSLDGYIASPAGDYDWIPRDPDIDFATLFARFDTFLIGRKTFDSMDRSMKMMPSNALNIVISRTLNPADHPALVISNDAEHLVVDLRTKPGKDIALFGGGDLFRSLLHAGLVDRVEVSLVPVLLGAGVPFLPPTAPRTKLRLLEQRLYKTTGIIGLEYEVIYADEKVSS